MSWSGPYGATPLDPASARDSPMLRARLLHAGTIVFGRVFGTRTSSWADSRVTPTARILGSHRLSVQGEHPARTGRLSS